MLQCFVLVALSLYIQKSAVLAMHGTWYLHVQQSTDYVCSCIQQAVMVFHGTVCAQRPTAHPAAALRGQRNQQV